MCQRVLLSICCLPLVLGAFQTDAGEPQPLAAAARSCFDRFAEACQKKDFDSAIKQVEVPFLGLDKTIIVENEVLMKELRAHFEKLSKLAEIEVKVNDVISVPAFRKFVKDDAEICRMIDRLNLTNDDQVVLQKHFASLIRVRNGRGKIAGVVLLK